METHPNLDALKKYEIHGAVAISAGQGGLTRLSITTPVSVAEMYLHGAHVTGFQKKGEPALLWMSAASQFAVGKAIRGGVPICFPWFGGRPGAPAHGFARITEWTLAATTVLPNGSVSVRLELPENFGLFNGKVTYVVTVGETLTLELQVTNQSPAPLTFEECLHTYFSVGDLAEVAVKGLQGVTYVDKVDGASLKTETGEAIRFASEVDRVYQDTAQTVEIEDAKLRRHIYVKKSGSQATVVWNPWVAKSKAMADFGDEEYHHMVCVESGNVGQNQVILAPRATSTLQVELISKWFD